MLRPDFTVPVVQMHMAEGAEPARYVYAGEVFRRQEDFPDRPNEYLQVGYEVFDRANPVQADAEVFALFSDILKPLGLRMATGDISILLAAVRGLKTTERRKAALLRHVWRPRRFRALLDRFGGVTPVPPTRAAMLGDLPKPDAPLTGVRSQAEIDARLAVIREDAREDPISAVEMEGITALFSVRETLPYALQQLRDLAIDLPSISEAVSRFGKRVEALEALGIDVASVSFEASYGRTSMEYYDGFVFGFHADHRPDLPPVASGGRYDALTERLGKGEAIPAVGGVIRPGLVAELEGAA
jgi:ATP phosphoribosyltransferase regulatory subunit